MILSQRRFISTKLKLGQYKSAIADFDEVIRRKPDHIYAYMNRGEAKRELRLIEEARADLQTALELMEQTGDETFKTDIKQEFEKLDRME